MKIPQQQRPRADLTTQATRDPRGPAPSSSASQGKTLTSPATLVLESTAQVLPTRSVPFAGGAPAAAVVQQRLLDVIRQLEALQRAALPTSPQALVDAYAGVGRAVAMTEVCLGTALDALDPRTGGGAADPAAPYLAVRDRAFAALRQAGELFNKLEPAFSAIVHGGKAWACQPVQVADDRGDGTPLRLYRNTYKKAQPLDESQRRAEYQERVERFVSRGGRFEDLLAATPAAFGSLPSGEHFDYVMRGDGSLRLGRLDQDPKPGHTLLAGAGPEFFDQPVRAAGELWVLKDSAGDVEAVIVANNSGHYKPAFADLSNTVPALEALGVPRDRIVLFGGPNNLPSMFEEMAKKFQGLDLSAALPPDAASLRAELGRSYDSLSLRLPAAGH
ncbi:MAG: hypothetical protein ABIJ09_27040 [Pseudomonadota bacterium]